MQTKKIGRSGLKGNCIARFYEWQRFNLEPCSLTDFQAGYLSRLIDEGKLNVPNQLPKADSSHLHRLARRNCHEPLLTKLRSNGFKVHVKHWRYVGFELTEMKKYKEDYPLGNSKKKRLSSNGGYTSVTLVFPDGEQVASYARCSKNDNFHKRYGVGLALARCIEKSQRGNEVFRVLNDNAVALSDGEG